MLESLGDKRGPVLFQLPPFLKKDVVRLGEFLQVLPPDHRAAFEFRHESWFDDAVYAVLRDGGAALCLSEREDNAPPPLVETTSWGYVRLRLEEYSDADLAQWAQRLRATSWSDAYVYFMLAPSVYTWPPCWCTILQISTTSSSKTPWSSVDPRTSIGASCSCSS